MPGTMRVDSRDALNGRRAWPDRAILRAVLRPPGTEPTRLRHAGARWLVVPAAIGTLRHGCAEPDASIRRCCGDRVSFGSGRVLEAPDRLDPAVRARPSGAALSLRGAGPGDHLPIDLGEGGRDHLRSGQSARWQREA